MPYYIPPQYKNHPDVTDWQLEGDAFQQMLKSRSAAYFAKPIEERPNYLFPEKWGEYEIRQGDWISGTGHLLRWPHLVISRSVNESESRWEFAKNVLMQKGPFPTIPTIGFVAIRLDDYLKYGGKLTDHDNQHSYFNNLVPLDDCLSDIQCGWRPTLRYWKIPEPAEVTALKKGQLTLF